MTERMRTALEQIIALRGYQGEDMGRVAGYRVAAEIAEEALRFCPNLATEVSAPRGWKLVPIEPTLEMRMAPLYGQSCGMSHVERVYELMISAAPQPALTTLGAIDD